MNNLKSLTIGIFILVLAAFCCIADVSADDSSDYLNGSTAKIDWFQPTANIETVTESFHSESIKLDIQDSIELFVTNQSKANSFSSKSQLQPDLEFNSTLLPPDRVKAFNIRYRMLEPHLPWFLSSSISNKFRLGGWKDSLSYFQSESIHS